MDIGYIAIVILAILVSMTLHEAMHAYMGYFLGDDTAKAQGRLTLNPLKHIDPFLTLLLPLMLAVMKLPIFGGAKPVPFNPHAVRFGDWGAALVAIAGPLTNLLLAFLAFGIGVIGGVITDGGAIQSSLFGQVVSVFVMVNLGFFMFNILPIPPLDGSRVLYALAPEPARRVMDQIERYGLLVIFAIILIGSSVISSLLVAGVSLVLKLFMLIFAV